MNLILISLTLVLLYLLFIWKTGKTFSILYLFVFVYFLQYIFSTYLIYNEYEELRSQMPIRQEQYFGYAVYAFLFLFSGIFIFNKDWDVSQSLKKVDPNIASLLGYLLLIGSISLEIIQSLGIVSIGSVLSFTSNLKYVAAFCFLFTNSRFNYGLVAIIYLNLLYTAVVVGMFIDCFIWSTYLFIFICLKFNFSFWFRTSFIIVAMPALVLVQSVKGDYRQATWTKAREGGIPLFLDLIEKKNQEESDTPFAQLDGVVNTVSRLSQGWHLGLVLKWVPANEPISEGKDMLGDLIACIQPRLIVSDKKTIGSQEKFKKYTGHTLHGRTSMTIGVLGDFYVNYGFWGSLIMLFIFGALIARFLRYFMTHFVGPNPINIVWVPFLLNYLVRANNDFYSGVNGIVKGFLIVLIVNFIIKQFWSPKEVRNLSA